MLVRAKIGIVYSIWIYVDINRQNSPKNKKVKT